MRTIHCDICDGILRIEDVRIVKIEHDDGSPNMPQEEICVQCAVEIKKAITKMRKSIDAKRSNSKKHK